MSAGRVLEQTLGDILSVIKPSWEDQIARNRIIEELRTIVQSMDIFRGATVEPFGSFVSGLFTRWGDLDISIELPNGSYISSAARDRKKLMLGFLQSRLIGRFQKLQFISSARVPIVKFESRSISCDVSVDNLSGQMKSKLLLWIKGIDARFGDMVLLVKEWAKAQEINNSKSGSFNSYSLTLLVIFHFQTCVPAILPPLKDIYAGDIVNDLQGIRADVVRKITETCTANIARWKSNRYRAVNQSSLSELSISFFSKFSDISQKARDLGICPYTGKWEALRSNTRW
ncbi:protein HESO1-like isoform X2 [Rhodamnia argentea]|nr:protein HESO1-like isoform X2 [Rhodamnia argentea]